MTFFTMIVQILKTIFLSGYGAISSFQYPRVYILGLTMIGIIMGLTALRIQIQEDYDATTIFLIDIDTFFTNCIDETNKFIQEFPNDLIDIVEDASAIPNSVVNAIQDTLTTNADSLIRTPFQVITRPIDDLVEDNCPPFTSCNFRTPTIPTIPKIDINIPSLNIDPVDLSKYIIPDLPFSFVKTLGPIVDEIYQVAFIVLDVLCIITYLITAWAFMPVFRGATREIRKIISDKTNIHLCGIPKALACCMNSLKVCCCTCVRTSVKMRVMIPIMIGIIGIFVGGLLILYIQIAESETKGFIDDVDEEIRKLVIIVNDFVKGVSDDSIDFLNKETVHSLNNAVTSLQANGPRVRDAIQLIVESGRSSVSSQLSQFDVSVPSISVPTIKFVIPSIPLIPYFSQFLTIPTDSLNTSYFLDPLVDAVLDPAYDTAYAITFVGMALLIMPLLTICCTICSNVIKSNLKDLELLAKLKEQQEDLDEKAQTSAFDKMELEFVETIGNKKASQDTSSNV